MSHIYIKERHACRTGWKIVELVSSPVEIARNLKKKFFLKRISRKKNYFGFSFFPKPKVSRGAKKSIRGWECWMSYSHDEQNLFNEWWRMPKIVVDDKNG